jgi:uncharacterized protein (DUF302 family)
MAAADGGTATGASDEAGVVTKTTPRPVADTVARLLDLLGSKGVKVFAVIDQQAEARAVGLDLRPTTLVIFGNPAAGTGVMAAAPLSALDLPLKVLVWAEPGAATNVSYTPPATLAARYGLTPESAAALAVVDGLTDALVAD